MVSTRSGENGGSGPRASTRFFLLALCFAMAAPAAAQQQRPQTAPTAAAGTPDSLTMAKLVWSALAALDHANQTGNYSVLRDLGAPTFQSRNSAATLAGVFQALRDQRVEVANALVVNPTYEFAPTIVQGGLLRARGSFPLRPTAIGFDLLFQNVGGQWRIFGMAVVPLAAQPAATSSTRR
jgi:hypothetical protein